MASKFEKGKHYAFSKKKYLEWLKENNYSLDSGWCDMVIGKTIDAVNPYEGIINNTIGYLANPAWCVEIKKNYKKTF